MFDGGEQFHQLIASSRASVPISLPFPLHGNPTFSAAFDPYAPPLHHPHPSSTKKYPLISTNLALESQRSMDPWSNDELLALLKVRSSTEIWFPDFNWEHVSRKLGELGFKRSGEECKDKFEEESRQFNSNKNYRILSELDEFYHGQEQEEVAARPDMDKADQRDEEKLEMKKKGAKDIIIPTNTDVEEQVVAKKRKRRDKVESFKVFCEAVVSKMMAKQEELHKKLIDDIVKRDEEKIAREEAWRNQEMDRIRTEIEIRSKEQKSAAERQSTIIEFLKHFTSDQVKLLSKANNNNTTTSTSNTNSNSNSSASIFYKTDAATPIHQNPPPSSPSSMVLAAPPPASEGDVGKRWPRDEVLALINLRCKTSGGSGEEGKEGAKGPLWEKISQGMMEMGYRRSAKRCKEKWENINKYFRKTKDSSKKRSVNSRTCPYFHQLSCLYSDGTIVAPNAAAAAAASSEVNQ